MGVTKSKTQVSTKTVTQSLASVPVVNAPILVSEEPPPLLPLEPVLGQHCMISYMQSIVDTYGPGKPGGNWKKRADMSQEETEMALQILSYKHVRTMIALNGMKWQAKEKYVKVDVAYDGLDFAPEFPMTALFLLAYLGQLDIVCDMLNETCYPMEVGTHTGSDDLPIDHGTLACVVMMSPLMTISQKTQILEELIKRKVDFTITVPCRARSVEGGMFQMHLTAYEIAINRGHAELWHLIEFATFGTNDYCVMRRKVNMSDLARAWTHSDGEDQLCRMLFAEMFALFQDYCLFSASICRLVGEYYSTRTRVIATIVKF